MQFRIEPWPHQGDQGVGQQHQQHRDHQQPKAHQGVDGGQQLGAVLRSRLAMTLTMAL